MSDEALVRTASMLPSILMFAVYVVGLGYAIIRRRRYPRAARLALWGLGALAAQQLLAFWMQFFAKLEPTADQDIHAVAIKLQVLGWSTYALSVVGTILLISAVFAGRRDANALADV
jgi:hypothetical protein